VPAAGLDRPAEPELYYPAAQNVAMTSDLGLSLMVRSAGSPESLTPSIRAAVRAVSPKVAIFNVRTMTQVVEDSLWEVNLYRSLIGLFALLALAIATVGVAGVLAFSVSQRTNELGIRLALGAEPSTILRMILGEGAVMALIGLVIGGLAAIPMSRMLSGLLFGVEPVDAITIAASAGLLVLVALLAAWVPARTATNVDPLTALRAD
jgi:putative ABC transport system permease protein